MNKNLIRLGAGFIILIGLGYLGHEVFVEPVGPAMAPGAEAGPLGGSSAYVVYPDRATEKEFKLDYPTFSGNFADHVTVTPLPPHFPGAAMLRLLPGNAQALQIGLDDTRCGSPVHVTLHRINDRTAMSSTTLDAKNATLSVPFGDGQVPSLLVQIRMDEKAENNYWCGVTLRWVQAGPAA